MGRDTIAEGNINPCQGLFRSAYSDVLFISVLWKSRQIPRRLPPRSYQAREMIHGRGPLCCEAAKQTTEVADHPFHNYVIRFSNNVPEQTKGGPMMDYFQVHLYKPPPES